MSRARRWSSEDGVASVAVAVSGPRQVPVAGLTLSAPVSRLTEGTAGRVAPEMRDRAKWLAAQLPGAS